MWVDHREGAQRRVAAIVDWVVLEDASEWRDHRVHPVVMAQLERASSVDDKRDVVGGSAHRPVQHEQDARSKRPHVLLQSRLRRQRVSD